MVKYHAISNFQSVWFSNVFESSQLEEVNILITELEEANTSWESIINPTIAWSLCLKENCEENLLKIY